MYSNNSAPLSLLICASWLATPGSRCLGQARRAPGLGHSGASSSIGKHYKNSLAVVGFWIHPSCILEFQECDRTGLAACLYKAVVPLVCVHSVLKHAGRDRRNIHDTSAISTLRRFKLTHRQARRPSGV